jgi:hypothetical protein
MKITYAIILLLWPACVGAQAITDREYDWEKNRKPFTLSTEEETYPEYILKLHRGYQYVWENNNLVTYLTDHRITKVKTTTAIERHNRINISMRNVQSIITIKARAINKEGKVTNFDQNNLKEVKDEKTDNTYRIFAIEGVEAESEIEYFYILKTNPKTHESYYLQQETPVREFRFLLVSPKSLAFDFRVYNDDEGKVNADTVNGQNRYTYSGENIKGLHEEAFSFVDAYRKRLEFKLAYNFASSTARLNTWADAGRVFYRSVAEGSKESEKELDKFVKTLKDNPQSSPSARIKQIEDNVKTSIRINKNSSDPALGMLQEILKSRQASEEGITKVLLLVFERLSIPVQLVVTCNREYAKFDGGFDSWAFLDEYLLYFPQTNGFLTPTEYDLRYPLIPQKLSGQKGLFIEPVAVGDLKTGISWIREIPALPYTSDSDNLEIEVRFAEDMESNLVNHTRTFIGYDAASMIPYYQAMSEDQRKKFVEDIFKASIPDLQLQKWTVNTAVVDNLPKIEITTFYNTNFFLERAGPRTLFKIGELIGTQSELYSEEERQLPVENSHNRGYSRLIRFYIPQGYRVNNLESLKMRVEYKDGDKVPFSFVSDYTENGNEVKVKIDEYYKELYAPLHRYEDFRKVINAAADFNKVTLVLIKN